MTDPNMITYIKVPLGDSYIPSIDNDKLVNEIKSYIPTIEKGSQS